MKGEGGKGKGKGKRRNCRALLSFEDASLIISQRIAKFSSVLMPAAKECIVPL